ncbi:MAG: GW dipeptide domain-containing protein, partial [Phototrophicales bacterium]|nr:GW dipeptide domain-containing protein [Phototrophicales bacterium]
EEQTALSIQDTATVVSRYAQQTLAAFFVTETAVYPVTEMAITLQAVQTRVADIQAATATYLAENTDEAVVDIEVTPPTTPNILLVASEGVTLYRESDVRSEALLSLIINDQFTVYGIAPNGRWLYVENEDGIFGWIDRFANNNLNSVVLGTPIEELPMLDPENPSAPSEELFGVHLVVIGDLSINVREYAYFEERANIFAGLDQFEVARIDATTPNQSWLRVSFVNARNRITNGWVSATLSTDGRIMIVGNLDDVRKINPLPLPTVTPSTPTTPTATPTETETLPATEEPPAEPPTDP